MQRLSMIALTAIAVLGLSGAAFTTRPTLAPNPADPKSLATTAPNSQTAFANSYYWYSTIDGSYNDYETVAYEIWEMEIYWGVTVNQNSAGGTLIEEGFWSENPNMPVMIWLYGHF
jgi:hypothetical protein